jgi:hypothetical protein
MQSIKNSNKVRVISGRTIKIIVLGLLNIQEKRSKRRRRPNKGLISIIYLQFLVVCPGHRIYNKVTCSG